MVYVDVTSSCKSSRNTGMQRTTRKIFAELSKRIPLMTVAWNLVGRIYQRPGRRELDKLLRPFRITSRPAARPERRGENVPAEAWRLLRRQKIELGQTLTKQDTLLMPDIYRDTRLMFVPKLIAETPARTVAIFHDATALRLPSTYTKRDPRDRKYIESLAAFDLVICISEESRDDLHHFWRKFGCRPTQTCVERWPGELEDRLRTDRNVNPSNVVLCVGTFDERKNHILLLRATEKLWGEGLSFELHLIGRSTGRFGHKVIPEIEKSKARGRPIFWLRHVNDETLHQAYRDCRFTVYPSLMEGFGLPIVESLLHGKPCLCGGNGALGEIARGGGCLIVDQTSEEAVASGIRKLLTDQETYAGLCAEAGARKFRSWKDYISNLLRHLHAVTRPNSIAGGASN